ncbi:accessory gene regulator B family protein [Halanaerocella petrolearia]
MKRKSRLSELSEKIIDIIYQDAVSEEKEIMVYGLKILLSTVIGYAVIIAFSSLLSVTLLTLTAAVTSGVIKIFSGGAHAILFRWCALSGGLIFTFLGWVASSFDSLLVEFIPGLLWFTLILGSVIIYFYAPAIIKEKQITSKSKLSKYKIYSFIVFFSLDLFYFILYLSGAKDQFVIAGLLGILWQLLSITPLGYKLYNREYIRHNN